jgi:hypothetical protein
MYLSEFVYPCITYVLRRKNIVQPPENLMTGEGWHILKFDLEHVEVGDIVCWNSTPRTFDATLEIVKGIPISRRTTYDRHFGVYEGDKLISDLTTTNNEIVPRIRIRSLDSARHPDYIYRQVLSD